MSKHPLCITPGFTPPPWKSVDDGYEISIRQARTDLGWSYVPIATVDQDSEEAEANANLIVASPDLYDALKDVLSVLLILSRPEIDEMLTLEESERVTAVTTRASYALSMVVGGSGADDTGTSKELM